MWLYKAENGNTIIIRDENLCDTMIREGLEFVCECDEKGKPIKTKE